MSSSYIVGFVFGAGLFGGLIAALIWIYARRKRKGEQYDERQKLAQLKGWRAAFIAAVCFDIINAIVVDAAGPWADMSLTMAICPLFIGVGVYAVVCIAKDAYTPVNKGAGMYMLLFLAIAAMNVWIGFMNASHAGFFDGGKLTSVWINFFAAALLVIIDAVYALDMLIKRGRGADPGEED